MNLTPAPFFLDWPSVVVALQPVLANVECYLVGGAVRDMLLHRPLHDLDLVTPIDGRKVARRIADAFGGDFFPLDPERGIGRALIDHEGTRYTVDVAQYRGETLADDLAARDFTLNAIAVPLQGDLQGLIDPLNGLSDIRDKKIRRCGPESIRSDPIRALRGLRQSVAFRFMIEPATRNDIRQYGPGLTAASPERVRDEFMTLLGGPRPHAALRALDALGLLGLIVPEITPIKGVTQTAPHIYDVWEHTLNVVERLDAVLTTISPQRTDESAADSALGMIVYLLDRYRSGLQAHLAHPLPNGRTMRGLLMLAALLHDCGKPATKSVGDDGRAHFYKHEFVGAEMAAQRVEALRLSNEELNRLVGTVRGHMRPMMLRSESVSRRAVYRYWKALGETGLTVCILTLADYLGMVGPHLQVQMWIDHVQVVGALLEGYFNQHNVVVSPPPLIDGIALMRALSLSPGPEVGRLLALIAEGQAAGEIHTVEDALTLARAALNGGTTHH